MGIIKYLALYWEKFEHGKYAQKIKKKDKKFKKNEKKMHDVRYCDPKIS